MSSELSRLTFAPERGTYASHREFEASLPPDLQAALAAARERRRRQRARHRHPLESATRLLAAGGIAAGLTLAGVAGGGAALGRAYHDRALPGVRFEGESLAGLSGA